MCLDRKAGFKYHNKSNIILSHVFKYSILRRQACSNHCWMYNQMLERMEAKKSKIWTVVSVGKHMWIITRVI